MERSKSSIQSSTANTKNGSMNLLVALMKDSQIPGRLEKLPDPASGEDRVYLVQSIQGTTRISEIQCLEPHNDYGSFLVGNYVVQNGNFHLITPVDPLFFVLSATTTAMAQTSWQPFQQLVSTLVPSKLIQQALGGDLQQLNHFLERMAVGSDELYYRFSVHKTLQWLQRKQQQVHRVLKHQIKTPNNTHKRNNGSYSSSFQLEEDDPVGNNDEDDDKALQRAKEQEAAAEQTAKLHSIQVVCNYLSNEWQDSFLKRLNLTSSQVLNDSKPAKKPVLKTTTTNDTTSATNKPLVTPPKKAPAVPAQKSYGSKRLAKVNTKGMKTMQSFFAPCNKKRKTKS